MESRKLEIAAKIPYLIVGVYLRDSVLLANTRLCIPHIQVIEHCMMERVGANTLGLQFGEQSQTGIRGLVDVRVGLVDLQAFVIVDEGLVVDLNLEELASENG